MASRCLRPSCRRCSRGRINLRSRCPRQSDFGQEDTIAMSVITNIEDLRVLARKRVPRMFYDYADSGAWTESTYRANEADFQKIKLRQRVALNMENRSTRTKMIGVD